MKIYTIGHSTKPLDLFIKILLDNDIQCLVDVRHYPYSQYVPMYNLEILAKNLKRNGIKYYHFEELGGRRRYKNRHHPSLQSKSFSSYAEYMMMPDFEKGLIILKKIARHCRSAIMCAESLWWRCHRRMIADRLEFDRWQVYHLGISNKPKRHEIWNLARFNKKNRQIYYDK